MNLIYMCVFHKVSYINLLKILVRSISINANINANINKEIDILIITSPSFQRIIENELKTFNLPLKYYILDLHTLFDAGCARLNIFNYDLTNYEKILYLDTDILINSDMNVLFQLELSSEKIYTLEEGTIGHPFWGGQFFDFKQYDKNIPAFTSGILLFRNSSCMKTLFISIQKHILDYIYIKKNDIPTCLDQPFIIYNAITQNKYDNQLLKTYVENNPLLVSSEKIVYHFPGGPGEYESKYDKMISFWKKMNEFKSDNIKLKICHHGEDGFGHQLEGMLRLISLSLNNKAEYMYDFKKKICIPTLKY